MKIYISIQKKRASESKHVQKSKSENLLCFQNVVIHFYFLFCCCGFVRIFFTIFFNFRDNKIFYRAYEAHKND